MMKTLSRFCDIRDGERGRVGIIAFLLFFLIAANNIIKIVRDSVFLSHHSVSELPYLYILVALVAGVIIAVYTRLTASLSLTRAILATNAIILSNVVFFWLVLTFFDPGWSHYAFYIWSAIVGAIVVAQAWTLVSEIFIPREGERLFGFLTAGGTIGGVMAAFGAKWAVERAFETNNLLWFIAVLFLTASVLVLWAGRRLKGEYIAKDLTVLKRPERESISGISAVLGGSRYLKAMALLILVSVIVSTLIDFEFKAAAKQTHPSQDALAAFFGSYYGWLSVVTFFVQLVLTRKILGTLGLFPSLYVTPGVLLTGSIAILVWPGLLAASLTRMADAALRNSVHRSSMEILYMAVPGKVKKTVKTFLDVVIERVGDAAAGLIILLVSFLSVNDYVTKVHFVCLGLVFAWILVIPAVRIRHTHTMRNRTGSPEVVSLPGWSASDRSEGSLEI